LKIDDSLNGIPVIRSRETRRTRAKTPASTTGQGNAGDSVEITQTSARLSRLEEDLGQIDSADPGKIEAVRQAIADGSFQVDEEAVADALVQSTAEQLRRQGNGRQ
jgi:negative regulator of flagellin synthesis FlgM